MAHKSPKISVVIPAYNEASYIDRLLEALSKQDFKDFEVIISDAQSKDGTEEVVKSFNDRLAIKFIESPPKGPSHGRNIGAKASKGEWLLFLDADDDIKDPAFIRIMLEETEKNGWNSSSAKMYGIGPTLKERIGVRINYRYIKLLAKTKHPVAPGWCIFTKRLVFEKNKGFNEKIHFGEDYDYVSRSSSGKFGFIEKTSYLIDLRRVRGEGWKLTAKGVMNEIYRHSHGYNLEKNPITYEFGKHQKRQP